ncbi:class I SAM-dependent methyltransferase [Paenibacillus antarcticus]|uniref:SAM-dependent methyltransferase n=1 Tax=Paenibacillus antarcticus TaxID=253703 RepID=A0A162QD02_9BACL|nr:class I SAM-dependent methyltransferase [Paenibacillus antarcticus]OAB47000.1 SAM-dependent methyltransferase [Paenibacillus antarcticus]
MIITTGRCEDPEKLVKRAKSLALDLGYNYVPRQRTSITKLVQASKESVALVVLENGARLVRPGHPPIDYHPSMGYVRVKRVLKGDNDPMLDASGMQAGYSVLDCTAGLGSDSLVFAVKAGPEGKVISLESSSDLAALLKEGMSHYVTDLEQVNEAMRRIEVRHGDHLDVLKEMPDDSVDIVYFDPMFRQPLMASSAINPLRQFANSDALSVESIQEAERVARKSVILKEKWGSPEFARLGFQMLERSNSNITYGVKFLDNRD